MTGHARDRNDAPRTELTEEPAGDHVRLRILRTPDLRPVEIDALRRLLWSAFPEDDEGFTEDDWLHATGGVHFILELDGTIVAHASVVERDLHVGGVPLRTGYVEAVATDPRLQGRGFGTLVMEAVSGHIRQGFQLGALGTGSHHFYERMGWVTWRGPAFVRAPDGRRRTPDEEGYILVLETPSSPPGLDLALPISCDWRAGDVW